MSLDMENFIDDTFVSVPATRYSQSGARDAKGKWVANAEGAGTPHKINLQPLSDKELTNLGAGGERIQDFRKFYVNDGDLYSLTPQDEWEFDNDENFEQKNSLRGTDGWNENEMGSFFILNKKEIEDWKIKITLSEL